MKNQDKSAAKTESKEKGPAAGCCCPESLPEMMVNYCEGASTKGAHGMRAMMSECCRKMKVFRLFPAIPMALGASAFLLGYFLSGEIIKILWLLMSGTVVLGGVVGFILMGSMCREGNDRRSESEEIGQGSTGTLS